MAATGLVAAVLLVGGWTTYRAHLRGADPWALAVADLLIVAAPLAGTVLVAAALARTSVRRSIALDRWVWTDVILGVAVAAVVRAAVELVAPTAGGVGGPFGIDPGAAAGIAIALAGALLVSPVVEEAFFRGLAQRALAEALSDLGRVAASVIAIAASTAAFTALHILASVGAASAPVFSGTACVGLACGILTATTGRLGAAIVAHTVYNASGIALLLT